MMNFFLNAAADLVPLVAQATEASQSEIMGVPLCDVDDVFHLFLRFGFHMLVCLFIVRYCYFQKVRNREYYKSFIFFAAGMFLLLFLLESIKLQIGLTLGLFAIFGVIRYRTETVPIKEMTYLFMIIVISVINGLSLNISYVELVVANLMMVGIMYFLEHRPVQTSVYSKLILYERIELIVPEKREEMLDDLCVRTGLDITDVEVGHIDFLRDAAFLKVYYRSDRVQSESLGTLTKLKP